MPEEKRGADPPPYPGAPRWVKVLGLLILVVVLLIVVVFVTSVAGPHGPWRHMRSGHLECSAPSTARDS